MFGAGLSPRVGTWLLRAVGLPRTSLFLIHAPPWVPPPASGTQRAFWFFVGFAFPELSVLAPPPWVVDTVPLVVGKSPGRKDRAGWQRRLSSGDFPTSGSQSTWSLSLSAPQHVYLRHLQPASFFLLGPVGACDRQSASTSQIPDAL